MHLEKNVRVIFDDQRDWSCCEICVCGVMNDFDWWVVEYSQPEIVSLWVGLIIILE